MPPSEQSPNEGWVHSDRLILPRQHLAPEEVEGFLDLLFRNVAIKPKGLILKDTAGVARYLMALSLELPGGHERVLLERLAEMIWLTLLNRGRFPIAEKQQVIKFLNEHSRTYLNSFDVKQIAQLVTRMGEPTRYERILRPPEVMGPRRSVSSSGKALLQDDLTERIYAAYHALRRARVRDARGRIASVLNGLGLTTNAQPGTWGAQEVFERVRQFEHRIVHRFRLARLARKNRIKETEWRRDMLVDGWIYGFRFELACRSGRDQLFGGG